MDHRQLAEVPALFRPLRPGRSFALVVDRLKRGIEDGELKPGYKLPSEPELANLFGLSRSVVREALKVLELSGYLEVRRGYGGGTFVCAPEAEEFSTVPPRLAAVPLTARQLLEVRLAIEPFAARIAALTASPGGLRETVAEFRAQRDTPAGVLRAAFDFHVEVARIGGNPIFAGVLENLRPAAYWAMRHNVTDPRWQARTAADHDAIAEAIGGAADARAESLMRAHLLADQSY